MVSTARPEVVDPKKREDWKGLSTTRNSRKCTIDDHRMWTGRVQHGEWSLFLLFGEWTPKSRWHVLARVYSAKNRNVVGTVENPVYVECWQFLRFLREDHWGEKDATLTYGTRGRSLLHFTKWPSNKGFTLFAQNVGHHEATFSTGYQ